MDFTDISKLSTLLSRSFAEDFFKLLVMYQDVSASEAASRLNQHIKTAQDFLDGLTKFGFLEKREVLEGKRPYFRYALKNNKIEINFDLNSLLNEYSTNQKLSFKIRENKNSGAMFSVKGNHKFISSVIVLLGEGRKKEERRINLTRNQGEFLYQLPFPNAPFLTVGEIIKKANLDNSVNYEIVDIVDLLMKLNVIELSTIK